MLTRLVKPPKEAADALKKLNISAKNSDGTMKPLSQTLQELRDKFSKLNDSQKASYASSIAGTEAMSGMLAIVNASDGDFEKLTASINNADGASKEMADTMNDNLKGAITLLKSNLESVGIKIYEQVQEPLKKLVKYATEVLSKVSDKIPEIISKLKDIAPTLIAIGAGLKLINFESIIENGGITEKVLGLISNKSKVIPEIFGKVGKSFSSFGSLAKNVMEGISTTFSGGIFEKIGGIFSGKLDEIMKNLSGFTGKFLSPFQALGGKIGNLLTPVKNVFDGIILKTSTFAQLVKFNIGESFNQAFPNFSAGISKIGSSFSGLFGKISPMLQNFLPMFTKAFNITAIIGLVVAGLGLLQGQFGEQINQIATMMIGQGPTIITNLVNGIVLALPQLIEQGSQLLQTLLNVIITNLPAIIQGRNTNYLCISYRPSSTATNINTNGTRIDFDFSYEPFG